MYCKRSSDQSCKIYLVSSIVDVNANILFSVVQRDILVSIDTHSVKIYVLLSLRLKKCLLNVLQSYLLLRIYTVMEYFKQNDLFLFCDRLFQIYRSSFGLKVSIVVVFFKNGMGEHYRI